MKPSEKAYELIKRWEGLSLAAYPDPSTGGFPWTIGYGHIAGVRSGDTCTLDQANQWLHEEVEEKARAVKDLLKVEVTQSQFDALVSFAYNLGIGNLKSSTLLKLINEGKHDMASPQFLRWTMAAGKHMEGLLNRRKDEMVLFNA